MSNNTKYVRDAFKSLELVEDKEFDLFGKDSFEELGDFIEDEDDVAVEQEVIDLDAEAPEELKDSYVGDVILGCPVCHTNLFKAVDDVVIDEETELCCVGEACPVCGQEDGFKVIGKVAPFEEAEEGEETEVEVETEPDEAEVEVKEKVKESKKAAKRNKLSEKLSKRVLKNKVNESKKLKESDLYKDSREVPDVAYDMAEEIDKRFASEKFISWDDFNAAFEDAYPGVIDWTDDKFNDLETDVRGILGHLGWETIFEGEDEGGLRMLDESRKPSQKRPLKESKGDLQKLPQEVQDIVGEVFDYTMDFDFLDIVADVLLRIDDFEEAVDNDGIVLDTVDDTLIYIDDQWEVLRYYFDSPSDLDSESWDTAFTNFASDIERVCAEVVADKQTKADYAETQEESLKKSGKKLTEAPIYDLNPQFDSRKSFYSKAKVDTGYKGDKNKLYSYGTLVAELEDGKPVVYGTFSSTTLRHIKDWLKQLGFKADNAKQIMADYGVKDENRSVRRPGRKVNESLEDIKSEWENMRSRNMFEFPSGDYVYVGIDFDKKTIYAGGATNTGIFRETEIDLDEDDSLYGNLERLYDTISEEHPEYLETDESLKSDGKPLTESGKEQITVKWGDVFNERQQGRLAALKGQKIDRGTAEQISNAVASHLAKKNLDLKDLMPKIDFDNETFICNVEKEKEMSLGEDIEKATIETEDQVIKVSSEPKEENMNADWFDHEGGELLPDDQDEEMIAPLDDEDIQEIEDAQQPEEEPEENAEEPTETEEENPEDEEEFEFDEIQEESFKRITESYLKKVYSNVRSFKINNIDVNENLLRIDGTIRFNSGKKKDTTFVFESAKNKDTIAKTKKRFVGLNETFTDKKDAFVLNTVINNKKFIAESLSYDYPAKTKDLNESVKTVKGIVK